MTVDEKLTAVLEQRQVALDEAQNRVTRLRADVAELTSLQQQLQAGTVPAARARRLVEFLGGI